MAVMEGGKECGGGEGGRQERGAGERLGIGEVGFRGGGGGFAKLFGWHQRELVRHILEER